MYIVGRRHDYLYTNYLFDRNVILDYDTLTDFCSTYGSLHKAYGMVFG